MHQAEPYGHLRAGKRVLDSAGLGRQVGEPEAMVAELLHELLEAEVFQRTADGEIFSPRMVRDAETHLKSVANGKKGGNPDLIRRDKGGDNPPPKAADNTQKPETREPEFFAADAPQEEHGTKRKRRSRKAKEPSSLHGEARKVWCSVFEEVTGKPYPYQGARDGKQLKELLEQSDFSLAELERRAGLFCRSPFWAKEGVDLKRFVSQWVPFGNAGRRVDDRLAPIPTLEEIRQALSYTDGNDPTWIEQGRQMLEDWGLTEDEAREMAS